MSHEPPVPPGNQSPYPIQEPPHTHAEPTLEPVTIASVATPVRHGPAPAPSSATAEPKKRGLPIGTIASAAAGAGAIAFGVAALLFPRKGAAAEKKKGTKRKR
jgi:hypothetical protein